MITYKNISYSAKTFYGVKFEPGEIKEVPGYINAIGMVRIFDKVSAPKANKQYLFEEPATSNRGRKKKSNEPEKDSVVEPLKLINLSEEETTNGN